MSRLILMAFAAIYFTALCWGLLRIQYFGQTVIGSVFYILTPGLLALIPGAAVLGNSTVRAHVTLAMASITLAVFSANAILAIRSEPRSTPKSRASKEPVSGRAGVVLDFRARGQDAYPAFSLAPFLKEVATQEYLKEDLKSPFQTLVPLQGVPNVCTALCNETGKDITYLADSLGFNNPSLPFTRTIEAGSLEIALVGDSYVAGFCMDRENSLVGEVRSIFPSTLGFGNIGNGPLIELALLREFVSRYQPRHVLWVYYENDLEDLDIERRFAPLIRYLEPNHSQSLLERQAESETLVRQTLDARFETLINSRGEPKSPAEPNSGPSGLLTISHIRFQVDRLHRRSLADFALFERILAVASTETSRWGGELHVVYLPSWTLGRGQLRKLDLPRNRNHKRVLEILRKLEIDVIDLTGPFRRHENTRSLFLNPGQHYSADGYRFVARTVAERLSAKAPHLDARRIRPEFRPDSERDEAETSKAYPCAPTPVPST